MESFLYNLPPEILPLATFLVPIILIIWQLIINWWWLPLPFVLWRPFKFLLRWWRIDKFLSEQEMILLEIKLPKEMLKPIRAMEVVMDGIRQAFFDTPGSWWERWVDGKVQLSGEFEIASIGGDIHFFIRTVKGSRDTIESIIFSQYPEAEISIAEDYTKKVPQDIPNKDWDMWGADYIFPKPDPYPIKTYIDFETEHEAKEEKRIDPIASMLEAMAKIKPGEQLWVQIIAEPIGKDNWQAEFQAEGKKVIEKLARRDKKEIPKRPILFDALDILLTGKMPEEVKEEKELIPPEMKLTPGEREVIMAVERKMSKPCFRTSIRFIFLGERDVFFKANLRLLWGFWGALVREDANALYPYGKTLTKIHGSWFLPINLLRARRVYIRKRKLFKNYVRRDRPLFPFNGKYNTGTFVLSSEELATIFHFPTKITVPAPFMQRVEAKKGEAPSGLPVE